ncbi:MAG: MFS transporter [Planctomycetaceae bacterium]|nr:MFS transporter [Planctomycetaceae bacterium]
MAGRLRWRLRWRLSTLWALEWGVTGAILTYIPLYFEENGLSRVQQGQLLAVAAIGLWVAPFIVGQVCDRWMASEKYLAMAHFLGGVTLLCIPFATEVYRETQENFALLLYLVGLYAIAYFPTVPLASALSFRHLPEPDQQFAGVRIWGTVGWVLSGLSLSVWLGREDFFDWLHRTLPRFRTQWNSFESALRWIGEPSSADCFRIAAILSFGLSSFCVFLPPTPPTRTARGAVAPLQTLAMFRDRTFTLLIILSLVLAVVVSFYTLGVPHLLHARGIQAEWVPAAMTVGQISEFPALLLMPLCLKRLGLKRTFALGMLAWVVRYTLFAISRPTALILFGVGLNGVCHVFIIIVIQLFIDERCRADLRTSAQNLFAFVTAGIGAPLGFILGGAYARYCENDVTHEMNYPQFFAFPAILVLVLLIVFVVFFRPPPKVDAMETGRGQIAANENDTASSGN